MLIQFLHIQQKNVLIVLIWLQETYSTVNSELIWKQEWGSGQMFFNHGTSKSKGVLICTANLDINITNIINRTG